ncbi:hypothetical protein BST97_05775 [Nonlabens spongiae]|uniref:DNA-binding response regulator n=1 Tax=Nonlabens spongiae TaxID=331648 RepID=A0A1W6MIW6_9FLAO|nr:response regulator transcription factor [Nonlabens spongiae]ARN77533.1 hypothetical protein BST97_05775 [Nonlabens spongiae]
MEKGKIKVYVVEDLAMTRAALSSILINAGFSFMGGAATAEKALADLNESQPDIFLLDYNLKGSKNGLWLAKKLRADYPHIKIIFLTAMGNDHVLSQIKEVVPDGYLMKPFNKPTLITTIELAHARGKESAKNRPGYDQNESGSNFFIKHDREMIKVEHSSIQFIYSDKNYVFIQCNHMVIKQRMKLNEVYDRFSLPDHFIQCHRRYIVNLNQINSLNQDEILIAKHSVPLSANYRKEVNLKISVHRAKEKQKT